MLEKEEIVSPNLEELKNHYRSIITLLGEDEIGRASCRERV